MDEKVKKIIESLADWQQEDKSNRSIIVIVDEVTKSNGNEVTSDGCIFAGGMGKNLTRSLAYAITNKYKDNSFRELLKRATSYIMFDRLVDDCKELFEDIENLLSDRKD